MEKLIYFWKGYIKIRIRGEQTERFLNLCRGRNICVRKLLRHPDGELTGIIAIRDFFLLGPLHRKTRVRIHIVEKHGMPFFFYRSKKRKAFFLGILLWIGLFIFLSGHIWNIHVEGNRRCSTQEILDFLEEQGVVHGISRKKVNCGRLAEALREEYPEMTWVSVKMEGTSLSLEIREGILSEKKEESTQNAFSLAAEKNGKIVKMITRAGVPLLHVGEVCKKGDILVSGELELKNDSQEVYQYQYVKADADIYIQYKQAYYHEVPLAYQAEVFTGKEKRGVFFRLGNWCLAFGEKAEKGFERSIEYHPFQVTESFFLPLSYGKIIRKEYKKTARKYTEQEAKLLSWEILQAYEKKLMEKGVQISANNVKIEVDHETCISKGSLEIIEKTGREVPIEIREQPEERTTEND